MLCLICCKAHLLWLSKELLAEVGEELRLH